MVTATPYELTLDARTSVGPDTYTFRAADGVCSKRSFREPELHLLETLWDRELGRLLVVCGNYGVVSTVLAERASGVHVTETSERARQLCVRNASANDVDVRTTLTHDITTLDGNYDTVAYAPKPYTPIDQGRQRIVDALSALGRDGELYLAASSGTGLSRYASCLRDHAASVERVAEQDGCSVLRAVPSAPGPPPTYTSPRTIESSVDGTALSLVTVPGLFSANRLDEGTRRLLETATIADGDRVLDLCCGYGAIGTYATTVADCEVWLSDDDRVATECARRSLEASGVEGTVITADCTEGVGERTFDRVLCNPPTHAGSGVLDELFAGAQEILTRDGRLILVHHRGVDVTTHLSSLAQTDRLRSGEYVIRRMEP